MRRGFGAFAEVKKLWRIKLKNHLKFMLKEAIPF